MNWISLICTTSINHSRAVLKGSAGFKTRSRSDQHRLAESRMALFQKETNRPRPIRTSCRAASKVKSIRASWRPCKIQNRRSETEAIPSLLRESKRSFSRVRPESGRWFILYPIPRVKAGSATICRAPSNYCRQVHLKATWWAFVRNIIASIPSPPKTPTPAPRTSVSATSMPSRRLPYYNQTNGASTNFNKAMQLNKAKRRWVIAPKIWNPRFIPLIKKL